MQNGYQKLTIAACLILILAVVDGCWLALHDSKTLFRVVSGSTSLASGDLNIPTDKEGVRLHAEASAGGLSSLGRYVKAEIDTPDLAAHFIELKGRLWRAELQASPTLSPGEHHMSVRFANQPIEEAPTYTVRVFSDAQALQADLPSLFLRTMQVQPWWVFVGALPLVLLFGFMSYRVAGRELDRLLAAGIGPIYKLARRKDGWEVVFGLGSVYGIKDGDRLVILDKNYKPVGQLIATEVGPESSQAKVPLSENISPSHFVARAR